MQILTNTLITFLGGPSKAPALDITMLYKVKMPFYPDIFSSSKNYIPIEIYSLYILT